LLYSNICASIEHEYQWRQAVTINYIAILHKFETLLLNFMQSDLSVWRKPIVWILRFVGVAVVWLWLITCLAAWAGRVPDDELGAVWVSFWSLEVRAPWAALVWTLRAEGMASALAWVLRFSGLVMVVPGFWLANALAGSWPGWPRREDQIVYGGHLRARHVPDHNVPGHGETPRVMVGRIKGLPWLASSQLVCTQAITHCVIIGEGRVPLAIFEAALKGYAGAIVRIGRDRLMGELVAEREILRSAPGASGSCPMDPLRQVRPGRMAWHDVRAMLYPCGFNERQTVLATALLVHALETAPPHRRTLADVVTGHERASDAYMRLNGWFGRSPLLGEMSKAQLKGLLDHWALAPAQLEEDLALVRRRLWAVQRGWHGSLQGETVTLFSDLVTHGPRVISFEIKPKLPNEAVDPMTLPLMQLTALMRTLLGADPQKPAPPNQRPILIALEADAAPEAIHLINTVRPRLKEAGISLLVHARSVSAVKEGFGNGLRGWLAEVFDTVVLTQPDSFALSQVQPRPYVSDGALKSIRAGEVVVVTAGHAPVRVHPVDPRMIGHAKVTNPASSLSCAVEPWASPAVAYPDGQALPKPKTVKIPRPRAQAARERASVENRSPIEIKPDSADATFQTSLFSKDDLPSSTARLKKALSQRAARSSAHNLKPAAKPAHAKSRTL
jgi:hypothetical protein